MVRRNILAGISQSELPATDRPAVTGYAARGASRSMLSSIGELAAQAARAEKLLDGETIVELDPSLIDASFVSDRLDDDEGDFAELVAAIAERGQDTPVLVRPHPTAEGRYQTVFGHRRVRAARHLGRTVKAVVRVLPDRDHVVAQGQENSARSNLSFIERAVFAERLSNLGYERETIQVALAIDPPMLTRMLSVARAIPGEIVNAIGSAKAVGRDRWLELKQLVERPADRDRALEIIRSPEFGAVQSDDRFATLLDGIKQSRRKRSASGGAAKSREWKLAGTAVGVSTRDAGGTFTVALKAKDASAFGTFISEKLPELYQQFRRETDQTGD